MASSRRSCMLPNGTMMETRCPVFPLHLVRVKGSLCFVWHNRFSLVDLAAVLPFYISLSRGGMGLGFLRVLRLGRWVMSRVLTLAYDDTQRHILLPITSSQSPSLLPQGASYLQAGEVLGWEFSPCQYRGQ